MIPIGIPPTSPAAFRVAEVAPLQRRPRSFRPVPSSGPNHPSAFLRPGLSKLAPVA